MPNPLFDVPPAVTRGDGQPRRVGVEVEFMGLDARGAAEAISIGLGGRVEQQDPHAFRIAGTPLGDLEVELDIRYVHPTAHGRSLPFHLPPRAAALLGAALNGVVPREVITAPLLVGELSKVDEVVGVLRSAGATGCGVTWVGSLGLHFNVDPPSLEADWLAQCIKAYLLLEPKLRREIATGRWRTAMPPEYPVAYVRRVVDPAYQPDQDELLVDYLTFNPTRDRSLDLLPILLHLRPKLVRSRLPFVKIGAKPVLHYRLPQAHVSVPGWSIAPDWNRWMAVERLAADPVALQSLGREYLQFSGSRAAWAERMASN